MMTTKMKKKQKKKKNKKKKKKKKRERTKTKTGGGCEIAPCGLMDNACFCHFRKSSAEGSGQEG